MTRAEKRRRTKLWLRKVLTFAGWGTWRRFRDALGARHRLSLNDRVILVKAILHQVQQEVGKK